MTTSESPLTSSIPSLCLHITHLVLQPSSGFHPRHLQPFLLSLHSLLIHKLQLLQENDTAAPATADSLSLQLFQTLQIVVQTTVAILRIDWVHFIRIQTPSHPSTPSSASSSSTSHPATPIPTTRSSRSRSRSGGSGRDDPLSRLPDLPSGVQLSDPVRELIFSIWCVVLQILKLSYESQSESQSSSSSSNGDGETVSFLTKILENLFGKIQRCWVMYLLHEENQNHPSLGSLEEKFVGLVRSLCLWIEVVVAVGSLSLSPITTTPRGRPGSGSGSGSGSGLGLLRSCLEPEKVGPFVVAAFERSFGFGKETGSGAASGSGSGSGSGSEEMRLLTLRLARDVVGVLSMKNLRVIFPGLFRFVAEVFFQGVSRKIIVDAFGLLAAIVVRVVPRRRSRSRKLPSDEDENGHQMDVMENPNPNSNVNPIGRLLKMASRMKMNQDLQKGQEKDLFVLNFVAKAAPVVAKVVSAIKFLDDPTLAASVASCCKEILLRSSVSEAFGAQAPALIEPIFFLENPAPSEIMEESEIEGGNEEEDEGEMVQPKHARTRETRWHALFVPFRRWREVERRFLSLLNFRQIQTQDEDAIRRMFITLRGYVHYDLIPETLVDFQMTQICSGLFRILQTAEDNVIEEIHLAGAVRLKSGHSKIRFKWFRGAEVLEEIVRFACALEASQGRLADHLLEILSSPLAGEVHCQCLVLLRDVVGSGPVPGLSVLEVLFLDHIWRCRVGDPAAVGRQPLSVKDRFHYVTMSCLCLDVIHSLARRISPKSEESERPRILFLRDTLFRLFEKIGDDNDRVSDHGLFVLRAIAVDVFGYNSSSDLISRNSDFIIDDLMYDLQYPELFPNSVLVVRNVLRYIEKNDDPTASGGEIFDRLLEMVDDLIENVSALLASDLKNYGYVLTILQIFDASLAILLRKERHEKKESGMMHRFLDQLQHFFGARSPFVRTKILEIVRRFAIGVSKRKKGQNELNVVSTVWKPLVLLVKNEKVPEIRRRSIDTVRVLLQSGFDDFLYGRFVKELFPVLVSRSSLLPLVRDQKLAVTILKLFRMFLVSSEVFQRNLASEIRVLSAFGSMFDVLLLLHEIFVAPGRPMGATVREQLEELFVAVSKSHPDVLWAVALHIIGGRFERPGLPVVIANRSGGGASWGRFYKQFLQID